MRKLVANSFGEALDRGRDGIAGRGHTCELPDANPFDYLTQLQRHVDELGANPAAWVPWNFLDQTR